MKRMRRINRSTHKLLNEMVQAKRRAKVHPGGNKPWHSRRSRASLARPGVKASTGRQDFMMTVVSNEKSDGRMRLTRKKVSRRSKWTIKP